MDQFLRKNLWVLNLLSLALAAFFLASGTGALLSLLLISEPAVAATPLVRRGPRSNAGAKTARVQKRSARDICVNNVFNHKLRPCAEDMVVDEEVEDDGEIESDGEGVPPYCESAPQLVATMASSEPEWAFVMLKQEGKTMPFRVGSKVTGLGEIKRVGWRLVLIDAESGPDCLLDLYPPSDDAAAPAKRGPSVASAKTARPSRRGRGRLSPELQKQVDEGIETISATERAIDRGLVDSLIENSSSLMSQARILPYEREGAVQGFKLYGIRRNSLLGKLGLRNGDIVNSIGGIEMTSPDRALSAYTKLRSSSNITLEFTRRGRRQTMDYNIR